MPAPLAFLAGDYYRISTRRGARPALAAVGDLFPGLAASAVGASSSPPSPTASFAPPEAGAAVKAAAAGAVAYLRRQSHARQDCGVGIDDGHGNNGYNDDDGGGEDEDDEGSGVGSEVEALEQALAVQTGAAAAVAASSGTAALLLALRCLGVTAGDELVLSAVSWAAGDGRRTAGTAGGAAARAASALGATVRVADVDPRTLALSPTTLAAVLTNKVCGLRVVSPCLVACVLWCEGSTADRNRPKSPPIPARPASPIRRKRWCLRA
jgi:hypothetical protein